MAYQCVMPGCPATHECKWQVCTTDESLQHQLTLASDLLRQCAEVLRHDLGECLECYFGGDPVGSIQAGDPTCPICAPLRDLLKRVEAVI